MSKKTTKSTIRCRATRRHLFNGNETDDLQGIRVTVAYPQKHTIFDMAKSINDSSTPNVADVLAVWTAMEEEIIIILSDGNRVELGSLGTLSLEIGTRKRKNASEGVTSKDIVAKRVAFVQSKRMTQVLDELASSATASWHIRLAKNVPIRPSTNISVRISISMPVPLLRYGNVAALQPTVASRKW